MIPCETVYNRILNQPFLLTLDALTSLFHLKMKYYNDLSKPVVVKANMCETQRIHEAMLKKSLAATVIPEKRKEACKEIDVVDLDVCKDETL